MNITGDPAAGAAILLRLVLGLAALAAVGWLLRAAALRFAEMVADRVVRG